MPKKSVVINPSEVQFDPASVVDDVGRVFRWRGGLYRGVKGPAAVYLRDILESKEAERLFAGGLVETKVTELRLPGYSLVLQHEEIEFPSYCMEWCSLMLRDAALLACELNLELVQRGYCMKDAHPWNIFFDFTRPVYIDIGSIIPVSKSSAFWACEFRRYFLLSLYLMAKGLHRWGRRLLPLGAGGLLPVLAGCPVLQWYPLRYHILTRQSAKRDPVVFFKSLADYIKELRVLPQPGEWSVYDQKPASCLDEFHPKQQTVHRLLTNIGGKKLIDMGCNKGWYSEMAALLGYKVVAFDTDDAALCSLYERAREHQLPILPLMIDFRNPTPSHGLIPPGYPDARARLACEVSLALALVHHLVFKANLDFATIAKRIDEFTEKYAIVEFIPRDDFFVSQWIKPKHHWYTMEQFIESMMVYFSKIDVFESSPNPRKILLFKKR
jgi:SAM-dependent methyltransferase